MATASDRLRGIVAPAHTAVVTMEMQKGIVGGDALLPALPVAVAEMGMLETAGRVARAARAAGVRVTHATMESRPDGAGQVVNSRLAALGEKRRLLGDLPTQADHPGVALADELDVQPSDIVMPRLHGLTPFNGTELDPLLRNLGIRSIVLMGVSVNVGIMGAALSACDLGYQVVVVRDAVCGLPREYAEMVLEHTLSMIATIVTADEVIAAWG